MIRSRTLIAPLALLAALCSSAPAAHAAAHAHLLPLAATRQIEVTLALRPRNAALLQRLAGSSSARAPLSPRVVQQLFLPTGADLRAVRAAMAADGLRLVSHQGLSVAFAGRAADVERAFGTSLVVGRRPDGTSFRRPLTAPRIPASIAALVQDVGGLDTQAAPRPLLSGAAAQIPAPSCAGPAETGGYLPSQLGSGSGYGHDDLVGAGFDGAGERIALVEFSGYRSSDVAAYQSCFRLAVPVSDVAVGLPTISNDGSAEVELDVETAISAAPGLDHAYVYRARPSATMSAMLNAIVAQAPATGVRIVSDSWGVCEPLLTPARAAATAAALQLAAVSGITVLAATGDNGSFDCSGFPALAVDDPAAQPFATGVGGTALHLQRAGAQREVVWDDAAGAGGGGLSRFWQRPSWQAGAGVLNHFSDGHRELPDLALHASPIGHGYVVYCTTKACGRRGWTTFGGTSAAAPLMAGIVADVNQYSLAHGGQRLGFANPFLYDRLRLHPAVFRDVTVGNNHLFGPGRYPATAGYDLATGVGSVHAPLFAADLAAYVPSPPNPAATTLTAAPARDRVIRYGTRVQFSGRLTDAGGGLAGEVVFLQGRDLLGTREWRVRTDATGAWSLVLSRQIVRRLNWAAVYLGSETHAPAAVGGLSVFVIPPLGARAALPADHGAYVVGHGQLFRLSGSTLGVLYGRTVGAEYRARTGTVWHRLGAATVRVAGDYARFVSLPQPGSYLVRWFYRGGRLGQWMSAVSRPLPVVAR
jgi:Pro-kumamolisin, activation domain/Subtilase family